MKKIGFNHFRRFEKFEPLELGEVTFLVGKNNSGKSTMVKAILLVLDYLKTQQSDKFSFANTVLDEANIVTFQRAKCSQSEASYIEFFFEIEEFKVYVKISGEDNYTFADVNQIHIEDKELNYTFVYNFQKKELQILKREHQEKEQLEPNNVICQLKAERKELRTQLKTLQKEAPISKDVLNTISEINTINQKIKFYEENHQDEPNFDATTLFDVKYPMGDLEFKEDSSPFIDYVRNFLERNSDVKTFINEIHHKDVSLYENSFVEDGELYISARVIDNEKFNIQKSIARFVSLVNTKKVYYLGANPMKQSGLFYLRDKQNALGQAIHQFYQLKVRKEEPEYQFIERWMKEFELGNSLHIEFISGEAYKCVVEENSRYIPLADMGMGSLQLMQLFVRIATIIRKYGDKTNGINLIVEEPELNLHPGAQSKLADFLYEVSTTYGIKFIIETHSEYIIRRSQVLGLQNNLHQNEALDLNPFRVYYFHTSEGPYEMKYQENGKFNRKFGKGFFDEADSSAMELFRLNRTKK
ncbi:AAA family ATPase [Halosquirtibacter xylanolyticus]|uniref:AAA family ATPase n=1 Tax=Halosquirtibacter xylanolyticus TaxID=3374599 RepID=UPI00374A2D2F|nr:AAA family ATPase [Prolixibacteraceae bacterium]